MNSITKNSKPRPQIAAMVARAFAGMPLAASADAVREITDGWFNAAYRIRLADGRDVMLKIAPPTDVAVMGYEQNIMATEVATMRMVRTIPTIPVPAIYAYDPTHELCDAPYFFMEQLDGVSYELVKARLPHATQASLEQQIGAILRDINRVTGPYFGYAGNPTLRAPHWKDAFIRIVESGLEDAARKAVVYDYDYAAIHAAVLRHASVLEEVTTPCLVHWDSCHANFLVNDERVIGIIDFERALWADPLMEVQFRPLFDAGITNTMRGYGKTSFTPAEEHRCQLYTLHLALIMHAEYAYRQYDTHGAYTLSRQLLRATMDWLQAHERAMGG
jgi:aminoglycoside phosphotransferase (APT) family kinase protein